MMLTYLVVILLILATLIFAIKKYDELRIIVFLETFIRLILNVDLIQFEIV